MGPAAESQSNIIAFPSQGAPPFVNRPAPAFKANRGRPPKPRSKRLVHAQVDVDSVRGLHNYIYLLCTAVRGKAPNDTVLKEMWEHVESIRTSIDAALDRAP